MDGACHGLGRYLSDFRQAGRLTASPFSRIMTVAMKARGFTLVELLVVVFATTLLFGVLLPALRASREQARTAACSAKIRQLVFGLHGYEADNGTFPTGFEPVGFPPKPPPYAGTPFLDVIGSWWFESVAEVDYDSEKGVEAVTCPSKRQTDRVLNADVLCGNYGANLAICRAQWYLKPYNEDFGGAPLSSSHIRRPGGTLLVVDSGYSLICWWHATEDVPVDLPAGSLAQHTAYIPGLELNKDKCLLPGQRDDAISGRHMNRIVNVGFVDGHLEGKTAETIRVDRNEDGFRNHRPLWQPD